MSKKVLLALPPHLRHLLGCTERNRQSKGFFFSIIVVPETIIFLKMFADQSSSELIVCFQEKSCPCSHLEEMARERDTDF